VHSSIHLFTKHKTTKSFYSTVFLPEKAGFSMLNFQLAIARKTLSFLLQTLTTPP